MGLLTDFGVLPPGTDLFGRISPTATGQGAIPADPLAGSPYDRQTIAGNAPRAFLGRLGSALANPAQPGAGFGRNLASGITDAADATRQAQDQNQQKTAISHWIMGLPPDQQAYAVANPDKAADLYMAQNKPFRSQLPASYLQMYDRAMSQWNPKDGPQPTFDKWVTDFNQNRAAAQAGGKIQGGAGAELPAALVDANRTVQKINELLADPSLPSATGWQGYFPSSMLPMIPGAGHEALNARNKILQLTGRAFSNAYETLKGGGPITDIEGEKATAAYTIIQDPKSSDADFRKALIDFRDAVQVGMAKLAARAGQPTPIIDPISEDNQNYDNTAEEGDTVYYQGNAYVITNGEPVRQ